MQDLKVTLVQSEQYWENKAKNWSHYSHLLKTMEHSSDLILLPEMFDTGFSMNTALAEDWENNSSLNYLQELSEKHQAAIYTSMMCREKGHYFNRGVFVRPDGHVSTYDKRKTFGLAGEHTLFTAGIKETIVEYKGWKIQLQICYDLRFPENARNGLKEDGSARYDLLLYVANWPERRAEHWKALLKARAIENQCYVAAVNRVGTDGSDLTYSGDSTCIDALGESLWSVNKHQIVQEVLLSKTSLQQIRQLLPFLKDVNLLI
jgi:predicted amidohydrolase